MSTARNHIFVSGAAKLHIYGYAVPGLLQNAFPVIRFSLIIFGVGSFYPLVKSERVLIKFGKALFYGIVNISSDGFFLRPFLYFPPPPE